MLKCNALNVGYVPRPGGDFCLQSHIKARIASAAIIAEMMRMMGLGISLLHVSHNKPFDAAIELGITLWFIILNVITAIRHHAVFIITALCWIKFVN